MFIFVARRWAQVVMICVRFQQKAGSMKE